MRLHLLFLMTALLAALFGAAPLPAQPPGNQPDFAIDAKVRNEVIEGAMAKLHEAYVFPEVAKKMEEAIRARLAKGEYDQITSAKKLCEVLTEHMREVSKDKHLRMACFKEPPSPAPAAPRQVSSEERRKRGGMSNFGFEKCERLPGNIGYLDFRMFAEPESAGDTAAAAMAFLANTDALIVDMRQNGGGHPAMVAVMCSYFFDAGQARHLNDIYTRRTNSTQQYWTLSYLPGKRYVHKDVYILTSKRTFSGAEEFTYNLKNLNRATVVGETTGGGAHPTTGMRINEHFMIGVPFARAINPITKTNWEGTGVTPDIECPADHALKLAYLAALKKQQEKATDTRLLDELKTVIATTEKELAELKMK